MMAAGDAGYGPANGPAPAPCAPIVAVIDEAAPEVGAIGVDGHDVLVGEDDSAAGNGELAGEAGEVAWSRRDPPEVPPVVRRPEEAGRVGVGGVAGDDGASEDDREEGDADADLCVGPALGLEGEGLAGFSGLEAEVDYVVVAPDKERRQEEGEE